MSQRDKKPQAHAQQDRGRSRSSSEEGEIRGASLIQDSFVVPPCPQEPCPSIDSHTSVDIQTSGNDSGYATQRASPELSGLIYDDDVRRDTTVIDTPPGHRSWRAEQSNGRGDAARSWGWPEVQHPNGQWDELPNEQRERPHTGPVFGRWCQRRLLEQADLDPDYPRTRGPRPCLDYRSRPRSPPGSKYTNEAGVRPVGGRRQAWPVDDGIPNRRLQPERQPRSPPPTDGGSSGWAHHRPRGASANNVAADTTDHNVTRHDPSATSDIASSIKVNTSTDTITTSSDADDLKDSDTTNDTNYDADGSVYSETDDSFSVSNQSDGLNDSVSPILTFGQFDTYPFRYSYGYDGNESLRGSPAPTIETHAEASGTISQESNSKEMSPAADALATAAETYAKPPPSYQDAKGKGSATPIADAYTTQPQSSQDTNEQASATLIADTHDRQSQTSQDTNELVYNALVTDGFRPQNANEQASSTPIADSFVTDVRASMLGVAGLQRPTEGWAVPESEEGEPAPPYNPSPRDFEAQLEAQGRHPNKLKKKRRPEPIRVAFQQPGEHNNQAGPSSSRTAVDLEAQIYREEEDRMTRHIEQMQRAEEEELPGCDDGFRPALERLGQQLKVDLNEVFHLRFDRKHKILCAAGTVIVVGAIALVSSLSAVVIKGWQHDHEHGQ
ncbi:hypothetical protein F5Y04DRAFT_133544 [Hypomontagnella monticulosa]|nr:hypothetical protein F5Y04DRAFT_133544 [Hypomontagnella monticulosa]